MYSQGTGEGRAELLKTSVEFHQCQSARNFFFSSSFRHVRALELRGSKEAFIHVKIFIKKKKSKKYHISTDKSGRKYRSFLL